MCMRMVGRRFAIICFSSILLAGLFITQSMFKETIKRKRQIVFSPRGLDMVLIPNRTVLDKMNQNQLDDLYSRYTNSLQVLCNLHIRVGSLLDGGKEVCGDPGIVPKQPCIIYSFGSGNKFDFEEDAVRRFGCEIHTFDHTMGDKLMKRLIPKGVTFHNKGIGAVEIPNNISTLQSIMRDLGHIGRDLDILKIDIERAEWPTLMQIMDAGTIDNVKQLLVEFHNVFYTLPDKRTGYGVFRRLYEYGFRTFSRERNIKVGLHFVEKLGYTVADLVEMSFVNLKYM